MRPSNKAVGATGSRGYIRALPMLWPDGKRFAFTVFDDTDRATLDNVREVYALLADLGTVSYTHLTLPTIYSV